MGEWINFFQSAAAAAATLIGLVVIAISINLTRILEYPYLPTRAAAALTPLAGVLVLTLLGLVPRQPVTLFGLELLAGGLVMWASSLLTIVRMGATWKTVPPVRFWSNLLLNQAQSLPFVAAGALLAWGSPAGAYWLVPGVIFSLLAGVANTWVLLVEIVR
jgi:hypothetical protein